MRQRREAHIRTGYITVAQPDTAIQPTEDSKENKERLNLQQTKELQQSQESKMEIKMKSKMNRMNRWKGKRANNITINDIELETIKEVDGEAT